MVWLMSSTTAHKRSRAQEQPVDMPASCCSSSMLVGPAIEMLCWRENLARTSRAYASMCGNCSFCARAKHLHGARHPHEARSILCFRALRSRHYRSLRHCMWPVGCHGGSVWKHSEVVSSVHEGGVVASALRRLRPADFGSYQRGPHFLRRCSRCVCLASALRLGGPLLATGAAEREAASTRCASMASACTSAALSPLCCATCMASVRASVASCMARNAWTPCAPAGIQEPDY